jgi:hypothetical protein
MMMDFVPITLSLMGNYILHGGCGVQLFSLHLAQMGDKRSNIAQTPS